MALENNYLICLLIICFFYSCKNERIVKEYYSNDNIKTIKTYTLNEELATLEKFDSLGRKSQVLFYSHNKVDSLIAYDNNVKFFKKEIAFNKLYHTNFYKNGIVESMGFLINDTLKNGWWSYFDIDGKLKSKRQYVLVCDDYYLNQSIIFNKSSDTVFTKDDFNETVYFKYEIIKKKENDVISYDISPISYRSKLELVFLKQNNFCNEEGNIDSIVPLENRKGRILLDKIKKPYSGFVFDYYIDTTFVDGRRKINSVSRKIYFNTSTKEEKR